MPRRWNPREMRLVSEYLAENYPHAVTMQRVRLGTVPEELIIPGMEEAEIRMLTVYKRYADALVILPDELILIEAAILPDLGDISKLLAYEILLYNTPELKEYLDRPVTKQLVYAIRDDLIVMLAHRSGIVPVQFSPPWIKDYLKELYGYVQKKRRAPLPPTGLEEVVE